MENSINLQVWDYVSMVDSFSKLTKEARKYVLSLFDDEVLELIFSEFDKTKKLIVEYYELGNEVEALDGGEILSILKTHEEIKNILYNKK